MKRVCAWCGKTLGYRKGGAKGDVTHGICSTCKAKYFPGRKDGSKRGVGEDKVIVLQKVIPLS